MNTLLLGRLEAIQAILVLHHKGGKGLPNSVIGSERELFVQEFLMKVMPPFLRFGRGCITDLEEHATGQLDLVIEFPIGPSFPMPSTVDRLYVAESVAAVLEVKSDLVSQWGDVEETIKKVKPIHRNLNQPSAYGPATSAGPVFPVDDKRIYTYAIGYNGHKSAASLKERLDATEERARPDGALVVSPGAFVGQSGTAEGPSALFAFIAELTALANAIIGIAHPDIRPYAKIAKPPSK